MRSVLLCATAGAAFAIGPTGAALAQDPCKGCVRDAQEGNPWCDDFEVDSGPNGQCYDTRDCTVELQMTPGCNDYYGWWNDNDVLGVISCDQNYTPGGEQCLALDANDDTVRVFDGYTADASEHWILRLYVYVPSLMEGDAYWIVLNDYEIDGDPGSTNWAIQCRMNAQEGIIQDDFSTGATLPLIVDRWVELRAEIFVSHLLHRVTLYYDDERLARYYCCEGEGRRIRAIDLLKTNGTRFYADDISLCPGEIHPPRTGDFDLDGDVDLRDFEQYLECVTAPFEPYLIRECATVDFDHDGDVDFADFAAFQLVFTGPIGR